ncbi:MAG: lipopolysaccharide biosynthesis protein, partial [Mesorhizobium sp.]
MSAGSGTPPISATASNNSAFERIANARRRALLQQHGPFAALSSAPVTPQPPEPVATVTLDKIGDFLELDFRRLFVW